MVAGTSTCHVVAAKDPIFAKGIWGPYKDWILPGYWMAEGGQAASGMLQWFATLIFTISARETKRPSMRRQSTNEYTRDFVQNQRADTIL
jgi:ribulose kinase